MPEVLEKELEVDNDELGSTDSEDTPPVVEGEVVEEKRSLKASSKKALDQMVNQLELEDWQISELGKKEKFDKEGAIVTTYTATLTKETSVVI